MVGSATPRINNGCPPKIECTTPHIAVETSVSTGPKLPSREQKASKFSKNHQKTEHSVVRFMDS